VEFLNLFVPNSSGAPKVRVFKDKKTSFPLRGVGCGKSGKWNQKVVTKMRIHDHRKAKQE